MKRQPFIKCCTLLYLVCLLTLPGRAQQVQSPNHRINVSLSERTDRKGSWFLSVQYANPAPVTPFPAINLGIERSDQSFVETLTLKKVTKAIPIHERYTTLHGKRSLCLNEAMEITADFVNDKGSPMQVTIRAYDDGVTFRYGFPLKGTGTFTVQNEQTSFQVAPAADRWLQPFVTSYEGFYEKQTDSVARGEWGFPALFGWRGDNPCWALITEADVNQTYCASKLTNQKQADLYTLAFPAPTDGNGTGAINPTITLPWVSPWRVAIIGQLSDLAQSTLVEDVSSPTKLTNLDWVKPGIASWVYWGYNHGTKDYKKLCSYIDLAARMGWPYTLIDWEWDEMENGGKLEDAVAYARSKGVKPLLWYNSGGAHNRVSSGPRDRLSTPESRAKEFAWLKKIGIYGIKVDFFESDKKDMITYYLNILKEAANYQLLVNFHGSTVPRGWSRTYPHLMSMEAVYGAEQYNNGPAMTEKAAWHNTLLPFTRNVIGPMDYTPIAFTNSQHVHTTSFAHELALAIVFESGIQHLADRPSGFDNLPDPAKSLLKTVPTTWDETRLIGGYPGQEVIMARRKGTTWYVGGINGEQKEKKLSVPLSFLPKGKAYRTEIIADGEHNMAFETAYKTTNSADTLTIPCLRRGGFSIILREVE